MLQQVVPSKMLQRPTKANVAATDEGFCDRSWGYNYNSLQFSKKSVSGKKLGVSVSSSPTQKWLQAQTIPSSVNQATSLTLFFVRPQETGEGGDHPILRSARKSVRIGSREPESRSNTRFRHSHLTGATKVGNKGG